MAVCASWILANCMECGTLPLVEQQLFPVQSLSDILSALKQCPCTQCVREGCGVYNWYDSQSVCVCDVAMAPG